MRTILAGGRDLHDYALLQKAKAKGLKVCIFRVDLVEPVKEDDWI